MDNYNKLFMIIRKTDLLNFDEKQELQLYLMNLQEQVDKQKEVIDKINKLINYYLKNTDESGSYVETNTGWKLIPEILKELEDILKGEIK